MIARLPLLFLPLLLAACIPGGAVAPADAPPPAEAEGVKPARGLEALLSDDRVLGGDPVPTWTMQPVSANARPVTDSVYVVRPGDTLRAIGEATGAGSEAIALANGLAAPFTLSIGQRLTIPAGSYHRVSAGETGIAIARAYGTRWADIVALNALSEPYVLRIGQRLKLPPGARPAAVDPAARAQSFAINIDDITTGSQPAVAEGALTSGSRAATVQQPAPAAPLAPIVPPARFAGKFSWPMAGAVINRFGPIAPGKINDGINISAPMGTPIRAAADGVVAYAGDEIAVYGGLILINHGGGWVSAYGHAARLDVVRGQSVRAGDVIALSGDSGQVTAPQLHFQLRKDRKPVDPLKQLPPR
ncbi:MAG: hypothetical protein RLZZ58_2280 [Pseudomonadota bacterium]